MSLKWRVLRLPSPSFWLLLWLPVQSQRLVFRLPSLQSLDLKELLELLAQQTPVLVELEGLVGLEELDLN